jgi:uncharacterized membrane protein YqaE (UPF0057 family)
VVPGVVATVVLPPVSVKPVTQCRRLFLCNLYLSCTRYSPAVTQ